MPTESLKSSTHHDKICTLLKIAGIQLVQKKYTVCTYIWKRPDLYITVASQFFFANMQPKVNQVFTVNKNMSVVPFKQLL